MSTKLLRPTERGQITIPKEARDKLKITSDSRFKVSVEGDKIIYQLVSPFDMIVKEFQKEAETRGYTKEELENELEKVRKKLFTEIYHESDD